MSKAARSTRLVLLRAAVSQTGVSGRGKMLTHPTNKVYPQNCDREHRNITDCHETYSERFKLSLTHQEIADSIGSTREMVSRLFSELRKKRLVESEGTALAITNRSGLESMVQF